MARRKLFSTSTRRRLFSDSTPTKRRKLFCNHVLVCQDCGYEVTVGPDSTTDLVCPNCGSSNRFNVEDRSYSSLTEIYPNHDGNGQGDKYCTELHPFECSDCHTQFESPSTIPQGVVCPNCGGLRVVQLEEEQHEFSDATDELLKEFSGKEISQEDLQKLFTERGINDTLESFVNSGYASLNDEGLVCFSERPDLTRRFFSELVISVTKELHLVPTENKIEELISGLEERGNMSPRAIVLVKKAHGFVPPVREFSETDAYIKDSGIANDLKLEYSGQSMPLKSFMEILDTQYNDAPEDLLDRLVESGTIKISGSQVEIL